MVESPIRVGQNAQDNWNLLKTSSQKDLWFHVQNASSAYVILDHGFADAAHILEAATEAKFHSKLSSNSKVKVIYCPVSNIRKGSMVGEAIIKSNKKCKVIVV